LLTEIQRAILIVQNSSEKEDIPPLESVTLRLSTHFIKEVNGKINFYIISLGSSASEDSSHILQLKLVPPKPGTGSNVSANEISDQLAAAIISTAKAVKKARSSDPPLILAELSAEIKFLVKKEGGGGVSFVILPVTADFDGKLKSIEEHVISIMFQKTRQQ
jgi:hypothetical protein